METVLDGFDAATDRAHDRSSSRARRRTCKRAPSAHDKPAEKPRLRPEDAPWPTKSSSCARPQEEPAPPAVQARPARSRARLRLMLLVVIPLIALGVGSYFYLLAGRYISTDNAYVGAQKVLITPDISGKIARVMVRRASASRRRCAVRDRSGAVPPRGDAGRGAACRRAHRIRQPEDQSRLDRRGCIALARENVELKQHDVDRKTTLLANRSGSQVDVDTATPRSWPRRRSSSSWSSSRKASATSCSAIPSCRSRSIRPMCRPPPRSTRPSAISTTPCCARRSPASRRRSPASSSAATSRPARRCSA